LDILNKPTNASNIPTTINKGPKYENIDWILPVVVTTNEVEKPTSEINDGTILVQHRLLGRIALITDNKLSLLEPFILLFIK